MGFFDRLTNMSPDDNEGLLAAAATMLQAGGPSRQPIGFGQAAGASLQAFQQGKAASRDQRMQEEQARMQEEQARMAIAMRALQARGMQSQLDDADTARTLDAKINESAKNAAAGGSFDPNAFLQDVGSYAPLKAAEFQKQFAKAGPKFDSGITWVNGRDGQPIAVRTADDGSIKQVDGLAPRDKAELVNLGGTSVAVNPFDLKPGQSFQRTVTPDAALSASTTMRGQNMADSRAREFNGLKYEEIGIKRAEKQREADLGKAGQIASFDTMLGTLDRLKSHPGLSRSTGLYSKAPTMPGSDSANFQAELETFKSQAFIPMVSQLKGMGALSDAEGKKLTAAVGALDPSMSESAFKASLDRVVAEMDTARKRVVTSASPSLQNSLGGTGAPAPAQAKTASLADIAETARRSGKSTAEVTAALRARGYTIGGK